MQRVRLPRAHGKCLVQPELEQNLRPSRFLHIPFDTRFYVSTFEQMRLGLSCRRASNEFMLLCRRVSGTTLCRDNLSSIPVAHSIPLLLFSFCCRVTAEKRKRFPTGSFRNVSHDQHPRRRTSCISTKFEHVFGGSTGTFMGYYFHAYYETQHH
jgi:hypothetical protein